MAYASFGCTGGDPTVDIPTKAPTVAPTAASTETPAVSETAEPTEVPTPDPTYDPTEAPTSAPTPAPTPKPANTPAPTPKPANTPAPTPKPANTPTPKPSDGTEPPAYSPPPTQVPPVDPDQSVFDDAVLIGNSVLHGLYYFHVITHGDFLTKVGLNVNTIYTYTMTDESTTKIIDELNGKGYKKVIINFGLNEVSWPYQNVFIQKYSKLIDDILSRVPGAKVWVVAVTPVTQKYSEGKGNEINITMERINATNGLIKQMCAEKGINFIPTPSSLLDSRGYLPADASSDGVHMNLKYDRLWADHITLSVMGVI